MAYGVEPVYLLLIALVFSVSAIILSVYTWVRYDPGDVFRRLDTVENGAPWSVMRQEMHAWTLQTEDLLETAGRKLSKAHVRNGGRPRKDAQPPEDQPPATLTRAEEIELVKQKLGVR